MVKSSDESFFNYIGVDSYIIAYFLVVSTITRGVIQKKNRCHTLISVTPIRLCYTGSIRALP